MKTTVKDKKSLKELITKEIELHGTTCDLNFIDISNLTDLSSLFYGVDYNGDISGWNTEHITDMCGLFMDSSFNGDISNWNIGRVKDMSCMFYNSKFNGDISQWNMSSVTDMCSMFYESSFNGDISNWNVNNVRNMSYMFSGSKFSQDLSVWTPYNAYIESIFENCTAPFPYWAGYGNSSERELVIEQYKTKVFADKLDTELMTKIDSKNKLKI